MGKRTAAVIAIALVAFASTSAVQSIGVQLLARGVMPAFVARKEPAALPEVAFKDGTGKPHSLAEWRGRVVLINLWATWCAPCRKEMPSLDRLQAMLGGNDFEVVAISVDRKGIEASGQFLKVTGATNLNLYVDETFKVARDLNAPGLPVSILVDRQGREVGRVTGAAEWDSDQAIALIRSVIEDEAVVR